MRVGGGTFAKPALRARMMRLASRVSPRHGEWQAILDSCRLDPASVGPSQTPGDHDVLVGGMPRSGTALLTSMLHRPPESIAVMEPWDALRMPPRDLFASLRRELAGGTLSRGRLDYSAVADGGVGWTRDGERTWPMDYLDSTTVIVKFPTFWQYLDRLPDARFIMCVRHPAATLSSFAATGGRLARGLEYDVRFNHALNQRLEAGSRDSTHRRALLYAEIAAAIIDARDRPNVFVVRYEDWTTRPDELLADLESFVGVDLRPPRIRIGRSRKEEPSDLGSLKDDLTVAAQLGYDL